MAASFEHSLFLELAISELEQKGIARESIYAFPLKLRVKEKKILDSINRADGLSLFDGMAACGTFFLVLGAIFGYLWTWGPIIWGLIGLSFGSSLGYILDRFFTRAIYPKSQQVSGAANKHGNRISEVVLIIECRQDEAKMVEGILWENSAIGVS
ncbi:MAG: hypothetical protein ACM3QW_03315 [Ignavibacteriales bacterium]